MENSKKNGFSMIEVLVSIVIIAILAAVLIPSVTIWIAKSKKSSAIQDASNKYFEWVNAYTYCEQKDVNKYLQEKYSEPITGFYYNYHGYTVLIKNGHVCETIKKNNPYYFFLKDDRTMDITSTVGIDNGYNTCMDFSTSSLISEENKGRYVYIPKLDPNTCSVELYNYSKVEFLQATGGAYIDLGFAPNSKTRVDIDFIVPESTSVNWLYGDRDTQSSHQVYGLFVDDTAMTNKIKYKFGNNSIAYATNYNYTRGTTCKVTTDRNKVYVNDVYDTEASYRDFEVNKKNNMYLFTINNGKDGYLKDADGRTCEGKIFYCRVWDDGTLIRDLYPSISKETGQSGFYDMLNDKFYANVGSKGQFAYGAYEEFK